ncbi:MAG: phosphate-starvation-inducible PsiE family protein [Alphaproteobacteria bacterium]
MMMLDALRRDWHDFTSYERFEQVVARILLAATTVIMLYTLALALIDLVRDLGLGMEFLESQVLQDAFGSFLTVLILFEFNHSIALSLRTRTGVIQARVVVLIAILVVARKLILVDFKSVDIETLAGLGGVGLLLGMLYWLLADAERRGIVRPRREHTTTSASAR